MQTYEPGVDVIVVAHRNDPDLDQFLTSLRNRPPQTPITVHVVHTECRTIVGGGRPGWTIPITYTAHVDNIGYNRAVNAAAARSNRTTIAVFNADVAFRPQPNTPHVIDRMHDYLLDPEGKRVAAVGPRQVDEYGCIVAGGIFGTHAEPRHRDWRKPAVRGHATDVRDDAVTVAGSALAARRSLWEILAACPDHDDFLYSDDGCRGIPRDQMAPFLPAAHFWGETWFCYHAAAHGYTCSYLGDVTCLHRLHGAHDSTSWGQRNMKADRDLFRSACDHHGIEHD